MKKTFRSILAGAVALLAVSCYDDLALREDLANLGDDLLQLDERVKALEATLNAEVGGINDLVSKIEALEGKIAAVKVETVDGVTTLTLSNDNKIVLSKNGVVSIVDGGWATVAADGTVTPLGIKVGHDLKFKVEDGELKVSADGTTYEATGVKIADYSAHVIGNIVPSEDGKSVAITVGDQTLNLPLVSSAVATLGLNRDSFYLRYSAEKIVEITAENLADVYVMNEPDGWKARIEDNKLIINSPSKKAIAADAAEADGLVLVHATDVDGKCMVAKLEVATGKGLTIECDQQGNLLINNSFTSTTVDRWTGEESFGFSNFYIGLVDSDIFLSDPRAYLLPLTDLTGSSYIEEGDYGMLYNNYDLEFRPYEEGVYETDVLNWNADELAKWVSYSELPYGQEKAIWVAPVDENGAIVLDEVEYVTYTKIRYDVEIADLTHNAGVANLNLKGATKFYVELVDPYFEEYGQTLETYMKEGGLWMMLQQPEYLEYYGGQALEDGKYELSLQDLNWGDPLAFDKKYYLVVFPYIEGTEYTDYNAQLLPYVHVVNTLPLQPGGDYAVTFTDTVLDFSSISTMINFSEGTESVYYYLYTADAWAELESAGDNAVVDALFADCMWPMNFPDVYSESYLDPGTTMVLATLSVGTDGKYGPVVAQPFSTKAVPVEENKENVVTFGSAVLGYTDITVNITPAEGVTAYYQFMTDAQLSNYATDADLVAYLVTRESTTSSMDVKVQYLSAGDKRNLVVLAVGEDNKYNIYTQPYTTENYPYSPELTVALDGKLVYDEEASTVTATFNVSGASKVAIATGYSGGLSSFIGNVVKNASVGSYSTYQFVDVVDGKATATFNNIWGDYMVVMAAAYVVEDGAVTAISENSLELPISENI